MRFRAINSSKALCSHYRFCSILPTTLKRSKTLAQLHFEKTPELRFAHTKKVSVWNRTSSFSNSHCSSNRPENWKGFWIPDRLFIFNISGNISSDIGWGIVIVWMSKSLPCHEFFDWSRRRDCVVLIFGSRRWVASTDWDELHDRIKLEFLCKIKRPCHGLQYGWTDEMQHLN